MLFIPINLMVKRPDTGHLKVDGKTHYCQPISRSFLDLRLDGFATCRTYWYIIWCVSILKSLPQCPRDGERYKAQTGLLLYAVFGVLYNNFEIDHLKNIYPTARPWPGRHSWYPNHHSRQSFFMVFFRLTSSVRNVSKKPNYSYFRAS